MLKKRVLCLLLALSLLSGPAALALRYPEKEHLPVDYADMLPVTGFDESALQAALKELEAICGMHRRDAKDRETRRRVQALYDQILSELNVLITQVSLSSVAYDASGAGEAESALYLELSAQQTRLFDRTYQVFGTLASSPYRDILEDAAGAGEIQSLAGYQGMTEEDAALWEEEDRLVQEYNQILSRGVPVVVEGRLWTWEELDGADPETCAAAGRALEEERNRAAGEVYRRLVQLRSGIAAQAGFDSYADYAYWVLYSRDYTPEDIRPLREAAKKYILPLQLRLLERFSDRDLRALDLRSRKSGEEILDDIQPFMEDFDREMGEAFAFLREHHLYDIEYDSGKLSTGYTVALPAYGSAFIFNSPYGDYRDYSDTVHEFGHFNETFRCTQHDLWADFNIDVGEIDSQALELMFTSYAGNLFGEKYGQIYADAILYSLLDSVLDGCLHDEFQTAVYADPDMSLEEINRLFKELSEEYGYSYDPGTEEDPSWIETSHNFENPLYFISYATSALSALDLWFLYLNHPRQGRELYLDLSALSLSLPYREAIEKVGLRDIFDPETIPELAEMLEDYLDGNQVSYGETQDGGTAARTAVLCVFALALWVLVFRLRVRPSRRVREETRRREALEPWSRQEHQEEPRRSGPDPWSSPEKKPPWEL